MSHTVRRPILVAALGSPCPYCGMAMLGDRQPSRDHIKPAPAGMDFQVTRPSSAGDAMCPRARCRCDAGSID